MDIICIRIASETKKTCIIVHLFSLSAHELTEIFQVPNDTNFTPHALDPFEWKRNKLCDMQTREMSIVLGIVRSLLPVVGAREAANILLHAKKDNISTWEHIILLRGTHFIVVQQNIVISLFWF